VAEAAENKSCGKDPQKTTVGSTKLKEPCDDYQNKPEWVKKNGVWENKG